MTRFVLLDESAGATTTSGQAMTPALLAQIAAACQVQLNTDFSAEYGGNFTVRAGSGAGDIQPGEVVFALLATLENGGNAIAYHDSNGAGVPACFDAVTYSDTIAGGGNSVSVAISHELLECAGDEGCNLWADDGTGNEYAREMCDAVEGNTYPLAGVYVSDFVLKAFWTPGRQGPYSFMAQAALGAVGPSAPFGTTPGGYQIERLSGTGEHQASVKYCDWTLSLSVTVPFAHTRAAARTPKRRHAGSRAARRGLRVA